MRTMERFLLAIINLEKLYQLISFRKRIMKQRKIRILVLGDAQVGKTSWITSLVSDNQPDKIPPVIDPVVFSEMFLHTFQVQTVLIDTPSNILEKDNGFKFREEVLAAQVILLLYDLSNQSTIESMQNKWMKQIEQENPDVPVIIIGNKRDMLDEIQSQDKIPDGNRIEKVIVPLIKNFKQVQMGFECSALLYQSISDVIYGAHRAVLFPLSPLYDIREKTITPGFERALARIFRICDKDNDNKWNDEELRDLQFEVFSHDLSGNDIQGIKQLIREDEIINQDSKNSSNITNMNEITFEGFKILQKKCVELIKMQICWAILRHFNYDDKLELDKKLFKDQLIVNQEQGQTVELSGKARLFLTRQCFERFCSIEDLKGNAEAVLTQKDVAEIFFPYPQKQKDEKKGELAIPFQYPFSIVTNKDSIVQEEWLNLWAYKTREDYLDVYKNLVYLGYQGSLEETFLITNTTNCFSQIQKMNQRYVYNVCLVCTDDCSKELFKILQKYKKSNENDETNVITRVTDFVKNIKFDNGKKKVIIFTFARQSDLQDLFEFQEEQENRVLRKFDQIGILFKNQDQLLSLIEKANEIKYDKNHSKFYECPKFFIQLANNNGGEEQLNPNIKQFSKEHCFLKQLDDYETIHKSIYNLIEKPTKGLHRDYIQLIQSQDNFFRKNLYQILVGGGILGALGIVLWANKSSLKQILLQFKKGLGF
ncbi:hypothetical protein ABPG74_010727 [Tetrahymena malaccensis]